MRVAIPHKLDNDTVRERLRSKSHEIGNAIPGGGAVQTAWPSEDRTSRLVLIVDDLDRSHVEGLWNAFLGKAGIDQPDAQALTDNPLSLRR